MKHGSEPDKIYYAYANADFTDLETELKQLFYHPQNVSCIDGDIVRAFGKYHLFSKQKEPETELKAVSNKLTKGCKMEDDRYLQQTSSLRALSQLVDFQYIIRC